VKAPRPRGGFTAEELIAALGIITVLTIGFFWTVRNVTATSRMSSCTSNVRQLQNASRMYMADHGGRMAPAETMPMALNVYTKNQQIFLCPSREEPEEDEQEDDDEPAPWGWAEWNPDMENTYDFATWVRADDPAQTLLVRDDRVRHVNRTWLAARLDGAVQRYDADEFDLIWKDGPPEMGGELPDEASN
jgi:type II secretory pathway pseudopilin PulG